MTALEYFTEFVKGVHATDIVIKDVPIGTRDLVKYLHSIERELPNE